LGAGPHPTRTTQLSKSRVHRCYQTANVLYSYVSRLGVRASRENGRWVVCSELPLGRTSGHFGVHRNRCHSVERDVDSPGAEPDSGLGESVLPREIQRQLLARRGRNHPLLPSDCEPVSVYFDSVDAQDLSYFGQSVSRWNTLARLVTRNGRRFDPNHLAQLKRAHLCPVARCL